MQERRREHAGVLRGRRSAHRHQADVARKLSVRRAGAGTRCRDQQDGRRAPAGAAAHGEQGQAVPVGPLQIVDDEHERRRRGHPGEERAELREESRAKHLGIEALEGGCRPVQPGDAAQDRKHVADERGARERARVERRFTRIVGTGAEEAAERVDDPVDGLVGDGLALVAAAGQYDGPAPADSTKCRTSALLPTPDSPTEERRDGRTRAHVVARRPELAQLGHAPDEGPVVRGPGAREEGAAQTERATPRDRWGAPGVRCAADGRRGRRDRAARPAPPGLAVGAGRAA